MTQSWTFARKLAVGFAAITALAVVNGAIAVYALSAVVSAKNRVIQVDTQQLLDVRSLHTAIERKVAANRGFLLSADPMMERNYAAADEQFAEAIRRVRERATSDAERREIDGIESAGAAYGRMIDRTWDLRRTTGDLAVTAAAFERDLVPAREELSRLVDRLSRVEEERLESARREADQLASSASIAALSTTVASIALALLLAFLFARTLAQQIGAAVAHVQSSSAELQSAANQQVTGAKEQATSMREISTTITELLATSRQIADSARSVAHIASQTAAAAHEGDAIVVRSRESMAAIRKQVDQVVEHMLELGRKSQHIGAVLDIVSELAEQTNILAINATIEAAGAGESGRRFAVVADEIRKLADRVGGSAKEIRGLIDDVRAAVNTTVMVTEGGSKAVDTGARQFAEVASTFARIAELVSTTTDAAREIELSTKQQTTAVEQVDVAISNAAQATRESEVSAGQTLETASQLTTLSRDLIRLVAPRTEAPAR